MKLKYDFGLAHGMAGMLVFLSKCYLANIEKNTCMELINGIFRFYLHNKQKYQNYGSFFPTFIFVEEYLTYLIKCIIIPEKPYLKKLHYMGTR